MRRWRIAGTPHGWRRRVHTQRSNTPIARSHGSGGFWLSWLCVSTFATPQGGPWYKSPGIVTWNPTEPLDLDRAEQDIQSLWTAIYEEYPADVRVQVVSGAFAVAEKHRLEGAILPEWLKARGLPDLAADERRPDLGLNSPEQVAWEARLRDRDAPHMEITLVLASRGSEESVMDLGWRGMVAHTTIGDPASALAPLLGQAAQRLGELGLTAGNL